MFHCPLIPLHSLCLMLWISPELHYVFCHHTYFHLMFSSSFLALTSSKYPFSSFQAWPEVFSGYICHVCVCVRASQAALREGSWQEIHVSSVTVISAERWIKGRIEGINMERGEADGVEWHKQHRRYTVSFWKMQNMREETDGVKTRGVKYERLRRGKGWDRES